MCDIPKKRDENLIVGFDGSDDAAVYRISNDLAMVQTLDFFTPIVDDPYEFGAIAAANALSDVYAMGGTPILALNIVGFPKHLDTEHLKAILKGGADKVIEAGAVLAGGHSIEDDEPKYGLSVMGQVAPDALWQNAGAQPGDVLILTKPLGVGILTTALKEGMLDEVQQRAVVDVMKTLNKYAAEALKTEGIPVNACTDITGFGLLGHALEMAQGSCAELTIDHRLISILDGAIAFAEMGIVPGGAYKNRSAVQDLLTVAETVSEAQLDVLCDPQTSGGLLIAVPERFADMAAEAITKVSPYAADIIGSVADARTRGDRKIGDIRVI